ncbi:hypothetical protein [Ferrovum sp.]|uniref:hypothetical protein n=1 Tax=Ferrovum sp. TaxID=2609467 RepID=UPI00260E3DE4|nr:hypothetical protein [Ferrovum sp.]
MSERATKEIPVAVSLWRFNKVTGFWVHERTCLDRHHAKAWLKVFQDDEPGEIFKIGIFKPKPTLSGAS